MENANTLPGITKEADTVAAQSFDPKNIHRPDRRLLTYYLLVSACTGPAAVIVLLPLLFKYLTLHYSFDDSGVSMRWGVLFRTEIYLTYRRIQDIHLTRNLLQRWLGLATVSIQTASGSATPEMKIEGILEAELLRDYLYSQMRGAKHDKEGSAESDVADHPQDEALDLLTEIRDALRTIAGDVAPPANESAEPSATIQGELTSEEDAMPEGESHSDEGKAPDDDDPSAERTSK